MKQAINRKIQTIKHTIEQSNDKQSVNQPIKNSQSNRFNIHLVYNHNYFDQLRFLREAAFMDVLVHPYRLLRRVTRVTRLRFSLTSMMIGNHSVTARLQLLVVFDRDLTFRYYHC